MATNENLFKDATTVKELLGQLAGYASMCWKDEKVVKEDSVEVDRVFDPERASKAVDDAYYRLEELVR